MPARSRRLGPRQTCLLHPDREAAALRAKPRKRRSLVPYTLLQALAGLLLLWFTAYLAGRVLLATPSDFHEGTVWKSLLPD